MSSKSTSCSMSTNLASHSGTISARLLLRSGFSISGRRWSTWCLQNSITLASTADLTSDSGTLRGAGVGGGVRGRRGR
jgi:hypothetical protein